VLFLLRPRQTYMPYVLPRNQTEQAAYHRELEQVYDSTRRVAPADAQASEGPDLAARLREVAELHRSGALSDAEFAAAKSKLLGPAGGA
jgi:hypothetical protein